MDPATALCDAVLTALLRTYLNIYEMCLDVNTLYVLIYKSISLTFTSAPAFSKHHTSDAIHQFVHGSELAARRQRRDRHRIRMTIQKKSPSWRLEQWVRKLKCSGSTGTQLESFPDIRVGVTCLVSRVTCHTLTNFTRN